MKKCFFVTCVTTHAICYLIAVHWMPQMPRIISSMQVGTWFTDQPSHSKWLKLHSFFNSFLPSWNLFSFHLFNLRKHRQKVEKNVLTAECFYRKMTITCFTHPFWWRRPFLFSALTSFLPLDLVGNFGVRQSFPVLAEFIPIWDQDSEHSQLANSNDHKSFHLYHKSILRWSLVIMEFWGPAR